MRNLENLSFNIHLLLAEGSSRVCPSSSISCYSMRTERTVFKQKVIEAYGRYQYEESKCQGDLGWPLQSLL